ncbi:MAG: hypothetical protein LBF83_09700 [Spirochaetaceae bacterium]|jgi:hypothetical protein|nr:hypothetical protein [Spirochaetaceae bacterium]
MARMTEEEATALDEEITNADITLERGKGGIFTRQGELLKVSLFTIHPQALENSARALAICARPV